MHFFSKNLRFLRKKGQLNQEEISLLFHKRPNTVGNWENQKSEPSLTELIKLAAYFHVSTESLLQADLEAQAEAGGTNLSSPTTNPKTPSSDRLDPLPGAFSESNPDAFWWILRELRTLHEKLDKLSETLRPAAHHLTADKSSH